MLFSSIPQSRQTFCSINFTSIKGFEYNSDSVIIWHATVNLNTTSFYSANSIISPENYPYTLPKTIPYHGGVVKDFMSRFKEPQQKLYTLILLQEYSFFRLRLNILINLPMLC